VLGAGQAGLAAGYFLRRVDLSYQLFERHDRIGKSWSRRWDSLVLFSPRAYSALPGLAMTGDPHGYPAKDEMAAYLENYADRFDQPVATGEEILGLERRNGHFHARTAKGRYVESRAVIVAAGHFSEASFLDLRHSSHGTWRNTPPTPIALRRIFRRGGLWWLEVVRRAVSRVRTCTWARGVPLPRQLHVDNPLQDPREEYL
jgi:glycine/D-amino acid oxidase-like deaminating enzyme